MARRPHHRHRRRSYGRRGHELHERAPRARADWAALEDAAAIEAAGLEAEREATEDDIPVAYTTLTAEDWVTTDRRRP